VTRTLKLSYKASKSSFKGELAAADAPPCAAAQKVTVFRDLPGRDSKIGTKTTTASGAFKLKKSAPPGVYFGVANAVTLTDVGDCATAQSKAVRVR
jgi:hypothetical protein